MSIRLFLVSLLCWPLLLWQGKRTRQRALRLPEAAGRRSGMLGNGESLRLLICGDSAAAGVGIAEQQQAFSGQLVTLLSERYQVNWQLAAKTGLDCAGLNSLLHQLYAHSNAVYRLDVVIVSIGVNDVTANLSKTEFLKQIRALLNRLATDFTDPVVLFSAIPPMQHFTALPSPLNYWLGLKAALLNQALANELKNWPKAQLVYSNLALTADMLAVDGFHPSESGCKIWAQLVFESVERNLRLN
ncbi:SGNH/GDSL hydrolase family protein [Arsukibacterium indicum]|uniref:SGNH/GDSL hydrolase family protein n=1 Tax=Arsukibacterium indicum TaxID=2848612 RepID=A0ABS6MM36_9GAMM|nr:SGNH/GDSL hydrolase family protein [Arsukibacterium indicum]MBV2129867.1 SGNH/GDSL hydrolase family protein [Arsukibacterium indicum]